MGMMQYRWQNAFALAILLVSALVVWVIADQGLREKLLTHADGHFQDLIQSLPSVANIETRLSASQAELATLTAENERLRTELGDVAGKLQQAEQAVSQERKRMADAMTRLQNDLQQAISSKQVAVEQVRDKFTVIRVGDKVLFDSGSDQLRRQGQQVLSLIAQTLQSFGDREIRIEGHSDNKPITSPTIRKRFPTNWELSSARATAAVRYLVDHGDLSPENLRAVGVGEFQPVASNETVSGRAKNRRIEIIVMPPAQTYKVKKVDKI